MGRTSVKRIGIIVLALAVWSLAAILPPLRQVGAQVATPTPALQQVIVDAATGTQAVATLTTSEAAGVAARVNATPTPVPTSALTAGAANGSSPPAPAFVPGAASSEVRGAIRFGSGKTPSAGVQVTVTFSSPTTTPPAIVLQPMTAATVNCGLYLAAVSTTGASIGCASAPLASQTVGTYQFVYIVVP